jgi:hypothetical protein
MNFKKLFKRKPKIETIKYLALPFSDDSLMDRVRDIMTNNSVWVLNDEPPGVPYIAISVTIKEIKDRYRD